MIKPLPPRLRPVQPEEATTTEQPVDETTTDESATDEAYDDEMFLDDDGELSSEVAIDTGLPITRKGAKAKYAQGHHHIVYKRRKSEEDTMSDYGKQKM